MPTWLKPAGFDRVGFFVPARARRGAVQRINAMDTSHAGLAQQIAQAAKTFEHERTGHAPTSVTVVLSDDALVIALHGALSQAEKTLARDPDGAAKVQEFHRQLFASSAETLRRQIEHILGTQVRAATAEIEPSTGAVVRVFATGTVVQVFLLAGPVAADAYSNGRKPAAR
jgi:uncharacterized protein YbcI